MSSGLTSVALVEAHCPIRPIQATQITEIERQTTNKEELYLGAVFIGCFRPYVCGPKPELFDPRGGWFEESAKPGLWQGLECR